jgi:hypothetical protein
VKHLGNNPLRTQALMTGNDISNYYTRLKLNAKRDARLFLIQFNRFASSSR